MCVFVFVFVCVCVLMLCERVCVHLCASVQVHS